MNTSGQGDRTKGSMKETEGKLQQSVGNIIHNDKMQRDGAAKETEGRIQKSVGKVKGAIGGAADAIKKSVR